MIYRELGYEIYYSDEPFKGKVDIEYLNDRGGKFADYIWHIKRHPSETRYLDKQLLNHPNMQEVRKYIEKHITEFCKPTGLSLLSSWLNIQFEGTAVGKHNHPYDSSNRFEMAPEYLIRSPKRTISGVLWLKGEYTPLLIHNKDDMFVIDNKNNHLVLLHPDIIHSVPKYFPKKYKTEPRISIAFDYNLDDEPLLGVKFDMESNGEIQNILARTVLKVHDKLEVSNKGVNKLLFQIYRDITHQLSDENLPNRNKYIDLYKKLVRKLEADNHSTGGKS